MRHAPITTDGRVSPLVWGMTPDGRSDRERLLDAIDRHLATAAHFGALCAGGGTLDEAAYAAAEKAREDSEAQLIRLVEDIALVPYDRLLRAMTA
ncbi:hypothetical protein [Sphingosinicella sp. BN140058]|uniref:hypothetical protein n=1 Tax=Sphingosinicella sp. BN140058 TaxID=1892855 RepID=UPI0010104D0C|nr:hypothetical protein [Sphingosinicella sp. BN140058]QAY78772.1 hypothetical protein ETR14_21200 [Sphingosinicella sp. BN140058]